MCDEAFPSFYESQRLGQTIGPLIGDYYRHSICCSEAQAINVVKPKEELKKLKGGMILNCSVTRYRI